MNMLDDESRETFTVEEYLAMEESSPERHVELKSIGLALPLRQIYEGLP